MKHQQVEHGGKVGREERNFLFVLMQRCAATVGTSDDEWYPACEASLNALFLLHSR